jgi:hypothetical protein
MAASREFSDSSIDLLHIDGYHTREAVSQDFSTWLPKVRDGGVVLFHDIMVRSSEGHPNFGVWSFWDDLKAQHKTWQFAHGFGLGIFIKGTNEPMSDWFDSATSGERAEYYARRGVDLASISAGKHALEERAILLEQTFKQQSEIARLQRKLEKAEDAARIIKKAVNRWNRRSWLTRACNRLELDEAK